MTATGNPAGGTFAWTVADASIATVSGSGKTVKVKAVKAGRTKLKVTYQAAGCTCTAEADVQTCTVTSGRKYAFAIKSINTAIGVRAKIKTRYGKLTCEDEGCSTKTAYHVVYANLSGTGAAGTIWAQSGFGRERNAGSTAIKTYRYGEMQGALYKVNYDTANAPAEGSGHLYQCELDQPSGTWTYSQDGTAWNKIADNGWKGKASDNISYPGEIFNSEDDMPGTDANKCEFTECQYLEVAKPPVEEASPSTILSDFGFDRSDITPQQQAQIDAVAKQVKESQTTPPKVTKVRMVGHTDPVGSAGYNVGLGQKRALAARTALADALDALQAGLSGNVQLVTESKGETQLVDTSGTAAGDAKNRRVEMFLTTGDAPQWTDAGLVKADVTSNDDAEWGAEWVSGTALNIWDKKPLP